MGAKSGKKSVTSSRQIELNQKNEIKIIKQLIEKYNKIQDFELS